MYDAMQHMDVLRKTRALYSVRYGNAIAHPQGISIGEPMQQAFSYKQVERMGRV
jgi:hypothetical protein